jgi:hypothetical protein
LIVPGNTKPQPQQQTHNWTGMPDPTGLWNAIPSPANQSEKDCSTSRIRKHLLSSLCRSLHIMNGGFTSGSLILWSSAQYQRSLFTK